MMRPLLLPLLGVFVQTSSASNPYVMSWSSQAYGPDGPWQAVSVDVGSNKQTVDLYPGANYASTILMSTLCTNKTLSSTCYAAEAGTFNQNTSTTAYTTPSSWETTYWAQWLRPGQDGSDRSDQALHVPSPGDLRCHHLHHADLLQL